MIVLEVAPAIEDINEILSLGEVKEFIRVVGDDEDQSIQDLIDSAITEAEDITNRQFAKATYALYLANFPVGNFKLPKNPINEIVKISFMSMDGRYEDISSTDYYLYSENGVGFIDFFKYPSEKIKESRKAIKIVFNCGYSKENFPADLKQYLKVRVSTLYEYREEIVNGTLTNTKHVNKILDRYKIRSI